MIPWLEKQLRSVVSVMENLEDLERRFADTRRELEAKHSELDIKKINYIQINGKCFFQKKIFEF